MSNRMPDENTNPVGTTQTSQNDQATTNQTWNDFVIDFWEKENKTEEMSEWVETSDINLDVTSDEVDLWESKSEIDLWFNDDTQESEIHETYKWKSK